ncbi:MAG: aldehyde dehydrogenase family protein [Actinomycetota bacterium]
MHRYQLFSGGEWVDAREGATMKVINPSTGEVCAEVARGGREDMAAAIDSARTAFDEGTWASMPQRERCKRLLELGDVLSDRLGDLAMLESENAGHTMRMANLFSIAVGIEHWKQIAELASTLPEYEPVPFSDYPAPSWGLVRREPFGVTGAITPWNFPFILMIWKVAPALATGNTVVVKPASYTPLSTLEFAKIVAETDLLPPGVLNVIPGGGRDAGEELAASPKVDKVAFTGSTEVGKHIMQIASGNIKKVTLELGGKSANILLDDADMDIAAPGSLWATFLHQGQICHSGTRLFVPRAQHDDIVDRLVGLTEGLKVGDAMDFESDLGPINNAPQLETIERYVELGKKEGAVLATGGKRASVEGCEGGWFHEPTIFADVRNDMQIAQEEIFGPVLGVIPYDSVEDAISMANDSIYGLAGGVWSKDVPRALEVAKRIRTGTVWINDYHLVHGLAPFGGYKQSGIGRELGAWGLREFQQTKYIHVDQSPTKDQKFWFQVLGL